MEHRTTAELEAALDDIRRAPVGVGRVELIVRRPTNGAREVLDEGRLDTSAGLVGDNWVVRGSKETEDGSAHPLRQLNVMSARAAAAIAGPVENWPLAGDQLFVDLHLGGEELPTGTRLQIGDAIIEVTSPPHLGCVKFVSRFGKEAMRFVNSPIGRSLNVRGICARVVVGGTVRTGDTITAVLAPEALTTA
jgi:MOSC domain